MGYLLEGGNRAEVIVDWGVGHENTTSKEAERVGPVWHIKGFRLGDAGVEHFEGCLGGCSEHYLGEEVLHTVFKVHKAVLKDSQ